MKRYLMTALAVSAIPVGVHAEPYAGPYLGIEGGMDNYELSADFNGAEFDGLSGDGVMGSVFVGYHHPLGPGFVAVEGFAGLSAAGMRASIDPYYISAKANESYGVAAKFGMRLNTSTGLYARVGWLNTRFKVSAGDGTSTDSISRTEDAIQYGAGLETMVTEQMALKFEYLIADYGNAGLLDGVNLENKGFRTGVSYRF